MSILIAFGFVLLFVLIMALGALTAVSVVFWYIYWIVVAAFVITAIVALCTRFLRFIKRKYRHS